MECESYNDMSVCKQTFDSKIEWQYAMEKGGLRMGQVVVVGGGIGVGGYDYVLIDKFRLWVLIRHHILQHRL